MHPLKVLAPALFALILVGGGCAPTEKQQAAADAATDAAKAAVGAAGEAVSLATTAVLDETWKTYTNKALDFEFRWPTRGKYAPMWKVTFMDGKDGRVKDGCVTEGDAGTERVKVGDAEFCHTWKDATSGPSDWYAVKHGEVYAVVAFTKDTAGIEGFSLDEYRAHLDQIVSTYKASAK